MKSRKHLKRRKRSQKKMFKVESNGTVISVKALDSRAALGKAFRKFEGLRKSHLNQTKRSIKYLLDLVKKLKKPQTEAQIKTQEKSLKINKAKKEHLENLSISHSLLKLVW